MALIVVGGTGLVGRHVVEALSRRRAEDVSATWHSRPPFATSGVNWVRADFERREDVRRLFDRGDQAIICAGRLSTSAVLRRDPITSVLQTLRVCVNVLEAAARSKVERVVLVSSCTGYPATSNPAVEADMLTADPPSQWFGVGWMHRYLEKQLEWYVEHLGLIRSAAIVRPSLIYGPHDDFSLRSGHFVPAFVRQVVERVRPIEVWGDGLQTRNLLHAGDLAEAILVALNRIRPGLEAFNVTSRDEVSVNKVIQILAEIDGFSDVEVLHNPSKGGGPTALSVSGEAFSSATGWAAKCSLRVGLGETLKWFRSTELGSTAETEA